MIPAIGHAYSSVVTEPTCTEKGYTTHTCQHCGATKTEVLPKKDPVIYDTPADYNNDGKINVRDVRLLMRFIAGLD